jgi:hypothetical protein
MELPPPRPKLRGVHGAQTAKKAAPKKQKATKKKTAKKAAPKKK